MLTSLSPCAHRGQHSSAGRTCDNRRGTDFPGTCSLHRTAGHRFFLQEAAPSWAALA